MCGIFGWAGKKPQDFNKAKLDILGIYNIERGKHSCGVSTDGDIFIGVDSNKVYHDFLANSNYIEPNEYPFVIGHTRHATGGAHNVDNAHPFGFGQLGSHYEFIGVHNGKLHNHVKLAEKYDVELKARKQEKNVVSYREKIDSELLLEILYTSKDFKVLQEYKGAAALVFCNLNEPNVIYFYHGESKKYYADTDASEERPLWFWQESKNSVYISSLEKSLMAIGGSEDSVKSFEYNTVYKVTDGNVKTAVKFKIDRSKTQQSDYEGAASGFTKEHKNDSNCAVAFHNRPYEGRHAYRNNSRVIPLNAHKEDEDSDIDNIYKDEPIVDDINKLNGGIYMNKLRYLRNGHLIRGIYAYVPKYGFYYLAESVKEAHNRFYDIINKYFHKRDFISLTDIPKAERKEAFIPFNMTAKNETDFPQLYYFYDGVEVKTEADYEACLRENPKFDWEALSICSKHPVCQYEVGYKRAKEQNILIDGAPATETIAPFGAGKVYTIVNGNCTKIEATESIDQESIKRIADAVDKISTIEKEILKGELEEIEIFPAVKYDDDLLEKDLDHFFKVSLRDFPNYLKRLKEYDGAPRAEKATEILEMFCESASKLMTIDVND